MSQQLTQELWNYCNILLDDVRLCGEYVGQLVFPLGYDDGRFS